MSDALEPRTAIAILLGRFAPEVAAARYELDVRALAAVDLKTVRARIEPLLPVDCFPEHASLLEEFEPDRWRELHPLPFGAAA